MWTQEHRARQAAFERRRYPTDLTDEEWERIRPLLPRPAKRGRRPSVDLREILNAIRYLARAGGGWRMLPHDVPPWAADYQKMRRWFKAGCFEAMAHDLRITSRTARKP